MYHYIRNEDQQYPFANVLTHEKYITQLKKFSKTGFINSHDDLFIDSKKYLLTFDDGLKDHIHAAELLKKNNGIGIFFIPTLPLKNSVILDVHKIHLITSKIKGFEILDELDKYLIKNKIKKFYSEKEKLKFKTAYKRQDDDSYKKRFKKIMNYYGNISLKQKILNFLLKKFEINTKSKDFYLNKKEIKHLSSLGMIIGSHSESHTLLSRLNYKNQFLEINNSKNYLEKIINKKIDTFCYPYGGKISYNNKTLNVLKKTKFKLAYTVDNKDFSAKDIMNKPYELPRYDCNLF
jgi:peptidoglycan/xylan/chitin deacetylase (PgdA/CDA1 family)